MIRSPCALGRVCSRKKRGRRQQTYSNWRRVSSELHVGCKEIEKKGAVQLLELVQKLPGSPANLEDQLARLRVKQRVHARMRRDRIRHSFPVQQETANGDDGW